MNFLEAYKRLEKLCGEITNDERKITAYIEDMEKTPNGSHFVIGWNNDLKKLKHYRWIRNQIVHDTNCSEENMCNSNDVQWIVDFHSRIMTQTDPLAMYRKATKVDSVSAKNKVDKHQYQKITQQDYKIEETNRKGLGCGIYLLIAFGIMVISLLLILSTVQCRISL